jgi:hypothetical protein
MWEKFSRPRPRAGINPREDSSIQWKIVWAFLYKLIASDSDLLFLYQLHSSGFGFKQELSNLLNKKIV